MTTVILVLHIILAAAMIGMILVQRNEGGALGMGGGTFGGLMTSRGTANLLTRITAFLATSFFVTTLVLAILFKGGQKTRSILDEEDSTKPVIEVPLAAQKSSEDTAKGMIPSVKAGKIATPVQEKKETSSVPEKNRAKKAKQPKSEKKTTPVKTSQ